MFKNRRMAINAISSIFTYGILLILSIVTSRIVLIGYGSETNGLLSSINQVFGYIALLEAGIGTATITALYKPIGEKNKDNTLEVLFASRQYYRSCALWYFICVIVAATLWPLVLETSISYATIWFSIFFQGVSSVIAFYYSSTIINYLVADGRNYINNNVHISATILSYIVKIVICSSSLNIVYIALAMIVINVLKCIIYRQYMKRVCPEYFLIKKGDISLLSERKSYLVHEISGVVFSGTDTIIISVFCGLGEASVYAVYSMVLMALRNIIGQVFNGTNYILGGAYSTDKDKYRQVHDNYNHIYIMLTFTLFSIAYVLLMPFIEIYTSGVSDANYLDPKLPILFVIIELLSVCRVVDNQLIKNAMHAKQTINRTIAEAIINLSASLILVQCWGIYGVLFGTVIALLYRTNDIVIYANKRILFRSPWKEYLLYLGNCVVFAFVVYANSCASFMLDTYWKLILAAIPISIGIVLVYALVNLVLFRCLKACKKRVN